MIFSETMVPRSTALKPEQLPADSKPALDTFTKNIGFTPNMMATFAQSPIVFNSWAVLLGSLSRALDVKTRDMLGRRDTKPRCPEERFLGARLGALYVRQV